MKPIDLTPLIWVDPFDKHPDPTTPSFAAVTKDPISTSAMANTAAPIQTCLDLYKGEVCGMLANKSVYCEAEVLALEERMIFHKIPSNSK